MSRSKHQNGYSPRKEELSDQERLRGLLLQMDGSGVGRDPDRERGDQSQGVALAGLTPIANLLDHLVTAVRCVGPDDARLFLEMLALAVDSADPDEVMEAVVTMGEILEDGDSLTGFLEMRF